MPVYRVLEQHVVSEREYRTISPALEQLHQATQVLESWTLNARSQELAVPLSGGRIAELGTQARFAESTGGSGFTPIGPGKPLTVMIRHVYTGRYPKKGLFNSTGDVAIVSSAKNFDIFNAAARALNFIAQGQRAHSHLKGPAASSEGTSVVIYSPAVLTDSLTLTLEMAVADFPKELVDKISTAFGALAGIPLLLPYAGYLLGAGQVTKLAGDLGHALFDGPVLSLTEALNFDLPGAPTAVADFRVICGAGLAADAYQYKDGQGLLDPGGAPYAGDEPYFVVSLDGKVNDALKDFAPTVASADMLQRFFEVKDGATAGIDTVVDGLKLVSDLKYRQEADALAAKISTDTDPTEKQALTDRRAALLKNILSDTLRPSG